MANTVILSFALICGLSLEGIVCDWSWSYRDDNGPKYWSKVNDDCSKDTQVQSPIDIPKPPARKYDKSMQELEFINYDLDIKGEVKNHGYTVIFNTTHENNKKMYIQKGRLEIGAKYVPAEFHFHFGTKDDSESGHKLEGKKFPMELHIVHYKDAYENLPKAKDYQDGVVIIVFFIEKGYQTNDDYGKLLKFISEVRYKDNQTNFDGFSLRDITNDDLRYKEDKGKHLHYFMYEGTLDTPPCYYVKWMVFKDPIPISAFQLGLFRQLKRVKDRKIDASKYDDYDKMAPNYRPLQELGDRTVYESYNYGDRTVYESYNYGDRTVCESYNYGSSADIITSCCSLTFIAILVCMIFAE